MARLGETSTDEMKALLAELEGAGGTLAGEARPYSRHTRGAVGSTNVLSNAALSSSRSGGGNVKVLASGNRGKPPSSSSAGGSDGGVSFSTYAVGPIEKDNGVRKPAPLGVRLAPLGPTMPVSGLREKQPVPPSGSPPAHGRTLNSLPPLSGGAVSALLPPTHAPTATQTQKALVVAGGDCRGAALCERETNFLPIMCARYLNPTGLTPAARWGHSLTAVGNASLYMFGGMGMNGEETNTFCEFDTAAIAWDPTCIVNGEAPIPRHSHAACAFENRYLVIHGGLAQGSTRSLADLYLFDTDTRRWKCLWSTERGATQTSKNEPAPRFGHTIVVRDDRLYVFGGKVFKHNSGGGAGAMATTTANADVYVFSLSSGKWRKRIRAKTGATDGGRETDTTGDAADQRPSGSQAEKNDRTTALTVSTVPTARSYHAACIAGDTMYINGGADGSGTLLSDTWKLDLSSGTGEGWSCMHYGNSVDAIPRERHDMFACGEALMLVGGCSPSMFNASTAANFNNFVAILPVLGQVRPCWIPVAVGNVAIVAPQKKSFGAAFSGGFVYVFGGVCGTAPMTNTMVRFLAADGYVSADARATALSNEEALRSLMQRMRDKLVVPYDVIAIAGSFGATSDATHQIGFHQAILAQRAPKLWAALQLCQNEPLPSNASKSSGAAVNPVDLQEDEVDLLLRQGVERPNRTAGSESATRAANLGIPTVYYTDGNTRVKGLPHSLSTEELAALGNYVYSGGLRSEFRALLEVEEEREEGQSSDANSDASRQHLVKMVRSLQTAAEDYDLAPLQDITAALLAGNRRQLNKARERSTAALLRDMEALLDSSSNATVTVLFVDPHTGKQSAHALHPTVLMSASNLFSDLLRPLYAGRKTAFQVGAVAAKVTGSCPLIGGNSKRAVLVGPVSVPTLAVQPILKFLYTQQLRISPDIALQTMMGAHQLGLATLQAFAESIVAREEVNYDSCCSFYYLSRKYSASLLQEMSLLTAISGYAQVRLQQAFIDLSPEDRHSIESVAEELGSSNWVPPPQAAQELKPTATYAARWQAASK